MKLTVMRWLDSVISGMVIEYRKQEGAMMKSTIFDGIIQFRHLWNMLALFEDGHKHFLTRDGSNFFCSTSQKSSNSFSHLSRKSQGWSPQHLYQGLARYFTVESVISTIALVFYRRQESQSFCAWCLGTNLKVRWLPELTSSSMNVWLSFWNQPSQLLQVPSSCF